MIHTGPVAVAQAYAVQENSLALVQHNRRGTVADPAGLPFAEHHICDADVLYRAGFYKTFAPAVRFARIDGVAWSLSPFETLPCQNVLGSMQTPAMPKPSRDKHPFFCFITISTFKRKTKSKVHVTGLTESRCASHEHSARCSTTRWKFVLAQNFDAGHS